MIFIEPKNELEAKESIYEILNFLSQEQLTNLNWLLSKEIEKISSNNKNNSQLLKTEFPIPKSTFLEKKNQGIFYKNYQPLQSKIYPSGNYSKKNLLYVKNNKTNNNNSFKPKITIDRNFNFEDEIFKDDFIKEYSNAEPFFNENVPFLKKKRDFFNDNFLNNTFSNNEIKKKRGRPKREIKKNDDRSTENSSSVKFKVFDKENYKKIYFKTINVENNNNNIKKEKFNQIEYANS